MHQYFKNIQKSNIKIYQIRTPKALPVAVPGAKETLLVELRDNLPPWRDVICTTAESTSLLTSSSAPDESPSWALCCSISAVHSGVRSSTAGRASASLRLDALASWWRLAFETPGAFGSRSVSTTFKKYGRRCVQQLPNNSGETFKKRNLKRRLSRKEAHLVVSQMQEASATSVHVVA